jgi:hypothetical protein
VAVNVAGEPPQVAGLTTIPSSGRWTTAPLAQALVENLQREGPVSAIEEAVAYQQLVDEFGLTPSRWGP